ncbi:hypothetical protein THASP1DRAFT_29498 [Thamnocephalis sphaerospora]|uniref:Uncharacterized protein n=1 Tax=Thamnocephalis sphaerospora TaxID=78915 RepID=A0A4P9XTF1_9FUNG|nr:hypothetical protein THASP1DRAFT_29498 [Thamnocephalis sphaerospora]|eukprot:RKP08710.1 hypothetical protein THASP1DRAFT_29498 [Thamnocephalis sphaerospora]
MIAGRKVAAEYLALATWGVVGGGVFAATRAFGSKKDTKNGPVITAASSDEESFIRQFVAAAEEKTQANKH